MTTDYTADDLRYMQLALAEAQRAYDMGEIPVGCIIVANGSIGVTTPYAFSYELLYISV